MRPQGRRDNYERDGELDLKKPTSGAFLREVGYAHVTLITASSQEAVSLVKFSVIECGHPHRCQHVDRLLCVQVGIGS
jgi:hypothetical protein